MTANKDNTQILKIKDCSALNIATGVRAQNLKELRDSVSTINPDSIHYHFWGKKLRPGFDESEYYNDFADWSFKRLQNNKLAERLSLLNPGMFSGIEELRNKLIEVIDLTLEENDSLTNSKEQEKFQFIQSELVLFDTKFLASKPEDMIEILPEVSLGCIYFHFIEAREEFILWLNSFGNKYEKLSQKISDTDPYFFTLTEYKARMSDLFKSLLSGANS